MAARNIHGGTSAVPRAVLHALELAREALGEWCYGLSDEQIDKQPAGIAPVAFRLRASHGVWTVFSLTRRVRRSMRLN